MASAGPAGERIRENDAAVGIRKKKNWRVDLTPYLAFIRKPPPRYVVESPKPIESTEVEKESENAELQLPEVPLEVPRRGPRRAQRKNIRVDLTPFLEDIIKATRRRAELKKQFQIEAELSWKNHLVQQSTPTEESEHDGEVTKSPDEKGSQEISQKEQAPVSESSTDYANSSTKSETVTIVTTITIRKDGSVSMTKHSEESGQKMPGSETVLNFCKYEGIHRVKVEFEDGIKLDAMTQTNITFLAGGARSDSGAQTAEKPNGKSFTEEVQHETQRGSGSDTETQTTKDEGEFTGCVGFENEQVVETGAVESKLYADTEGFSGNN